MRSNATWRRDPDALPLHLGLAGTMIDDAGNDEQEIGEPIDVCEQMRLDMIRTERDNRSFGAAAHGPREMQQRTGSIAAGQNEAAQRREFCLESIDPLFESSNVGVRHRDFRDTFCDFFAGSASRAPMATDPSAAARSVRRCPR